MDIWLFLLVLAAILIGWLLGRWQPFNKISANQGSDLFSERYARGLNYLLADDSDNAIKIFTDLIEVNKDTIEIHISLGNLFRSKGEVDRAIKVHQNLLARPNLTRKQRHMAISELASDYLKAGLLDRAEKLYREMIELKVEPRHAYRRLLDLYITEKSWDEAVECANQLYSLGENEAALMYSQCLCETAAIAIENGNHRLARKNLDRAVEVDAKCVRAALLLIKLHLKIGDSSAAKSIFLRLVRQSPEYMGLYIDPARQIYHNKEDRVYQEFLQEQYRLHPSTRLAIALLEHYARNDEIEKARQFLSDTLNKSPSFEAFEFALRFLKSNPDQLGETWETLSSFLKQLQDKKTEYVCSQCGYESHAIQWLCPSCRNWASMKMIKV
ncbi:MAG: lipopolysaccharide assembly protein LapB [Gammaproteobacteria bacterium]|nr:lipopolysaccharide assembly protein LapB [Gammaproteobacteria bacterium]MCP4980196.1 lipopolysaccharide assembly protein LapB [Gammaproteobacteria bacterium]